ncbi:translation initiation factor IF-2-like [Zalophus californianus]|uniref:Translation initiation factor IF-2-like n=1 Tax=Zalophus californianus TaxID=9704 RepID=A0A6J2DIT1_ZALCA|nr:translation initiation factor IF-2-like [Zalophus californianus]
MVVLPIAPSSESSGAVSYSVQGSEEEEGAARGPSVGQPESTMARSLNSSVWPGSARRSGRVRTSLCCSPSTSRSRPGLPRSAAVRGPGYQPRPSPIPHLGEPGTQRGDRIVQPEESPPGSPPCARSERRGASPRRTESGPSGKRNQHSGRRQRDPRARPPTGWRHLGVLTAGARARAARRRRAPADTPRPRPRPGRAPGTPASGTAAARARPAPAPAPSPALAPGTHQLPVKVAGRRRLRRRSTVTRVQSGGRDGAARRGPRRAGCGLGARGGAAAPPAAGWRLQRVGPGGATAGERAADSPERRERNWLSLGSAKRSQLLPGARICILRQEGGEVTVWPLPKVWVFGVAVARALKAERLSLSVCRSGMWSRWGPTSSCDGGRRIFQGDPLEPGRGSLATKPLASPLLLFHRTPYKWGTPDSRGGTLWSPTSGVLKKEDEMGRVDVQRLSS